MAIGIQNSSGVDFDSLFEQRIAGDPTAPTTGLQTSAGSDIANRYVPLSFSGSQTPNLTYVQATDGTDCKYIFAALGTVVRILTPWNGKTYSASAFGGGVQFTEATLAFLLNNNGTFSASGTATPTGQVSSDSGTWLPIGSASDFEARFTVNVTDGSPSSVTYPTGWVSLATPRTVAMSASTITSTSYVAATITLEIRKISNPQIVSTSTFGMAVSAES